MTRRDVAAMRLALCQLRAGELGTAIGTLREGDDEAHAVGCAAFDAWADEGLYIVTARLALYLRARLRAEAGDCATREARSGWRCVACGSNDLRFVWDRLAVVKQGGVDPGACRNCGGAADWIEVPPFVPMWEQAAQWWATHERPGGGR